MRSLAQFVTAAVPVFAQPSFLVLTDEERRAACRELGHEYVEAGVEGLLSFEVCRRCGCLPYSRGGR